MNNYGEFVWDINEDEEAMIFRNPSMLINYQTPFTCTQINDCNLTNVQCHFTSDGVQTWSCEVMRFMPRVKWTVQDTGTSRNKRHEANGFCPSSHYPLGAGVCLWSPTPLVRGNLEIFSGDGIYALGFGWKLFCLGIRQRPIVYQYHCASKIWALPFWIQSNEGKCKDEEL